MILCNIFGHRWDPEAYANGFPDSCLRCGFCPMYDGEYDEPWHLRTIGTIRWKAHLLRPKTRDWLRCPYCGGRFGRCREDCLPF